MKYVLYLEGGIGKNIALTGVFKKFADVNDGIIVISPHDYIFYNIPGIETYNPTQKKLYENVIKENIFIAVEPYHHFDTYNKGESIIKTSAKILASYKPGEYEAQPKLYFNTYEKNEAEEFRSREINKNGYILFQPFGASMGPHGDHTSRSLEFDFAQKVADELTKRLPTYQISAPGLPILNGCLGFNPATTSRQIMSISMHATYIITIDSFMNHVAPAVGKKAIVIWGSTPESVFGYTTNINIREFKCPNFIPTKLMINDPDLDERNSYSNKFTDVTLKRIMEALNEIK